MTATRPGLALVFALAAKIALANDNLTPNAFIDRPPRIAPALSGLVVASERDPEVEARVLSTLHHASRFEIRAGRLAGAKAVDPAVRALADRIVSDREQAQKDIDGIAASLGLVLAERKDAASPEEKTDREDESETMAKLESLLGPDFDREYVAFCEQRQRKAIDFLTPTRGRLKGTRTGDFVAGLLSTVEKERAIALRLTERRVLAE